MYFDDNNYKNNEALIKFLSNKDKHFLEKKQTLLFIFFTQLIILIFALILFYYICIILHSLNNDLNIKI